MPAPTVENLRAYLGLGAGDAAEAMLAPALAGAVAYVKRNYPAAVTGTDGTPAGDDVKDAMLTLAARRYHERNTGYQDAYETSAGPMFVKQLPASVAVVLESYAPPRWFVG